MSQRRRPFPMPPAMRCPICGTWTVGLFCSRACAVRYRDLDDEQKAALHQPGAVLDDAQTESLEGGR